jgi:hypothetical protein
VPSTTATRRELELLADDAATLSIARRPSCRRGSAASEGLGVGRRVISASLGDDLVASSWNWAFLATKSVSQLSSMIAPRHRGDQAVAGVALGALGRRPWRP